MSLASEQRGAEKAARIQAGREHDREVRRRLRPLILGVALAVLVLFSVAFFAGYRYI